MTPVPDRPGGDPITIYVDADACPVKTEVARVAGRHRLRVAFVANSRMGIPPGERFEMVVARGDFDAADDWIALRVAAKDIVVTSDLPLAARCIAKGARVLDPKGRVFTEESMGDVLANRELMAHLREMGSITGGPAPFEKRDRSRFLERLEFLIQSIGREEG